MERRQPGVTQGLVESVNAEEKRNLRTDEVKSPHHSRGVTVAGCRIKKKIFEGTRDKK